jgi:SPX domain protein involved in polyphosphate accumulation
MTAPPPTNAQGLDTSKVPITEESFLTLVDQDIVRIEKFTLSQVTLIRNKLSEVETQLKQDEASSTAVAHEMMSQKADEIANDFLRLEKYVNINFMGLHKILKKVCTTRKIFRIHSLYECTYCTQSDNFLLSSHTRFILSLPMEPHT